MRLHFVKQVIKRVYIAHAVVLSRQPSVIQQQSLKPTGPPRYRRSLIEIFSQIPTMLFPAMFLIFATVLPGPVESALTLSYVTEPIV
jgi:hypothetical protein